MWGGKTAWDPRNRWLCALLRPNVVQSLSWAHVYLSFQPPELPKMFKCYSCTILSWRPGLHSCVSKQLLSTVPTFQKFPCSTQLQEYTEQLGHAAYLGTCTKGRTTGELQEGRRAYSVWLPSQVAVHLCRAIVPVGNWYCCLQWTQAG